MLFEFEKTKTAQCHTDGVGHGIAPIAKAAGHEILMQFVGAAVQRSQHAGEEYDLRGAALRLGLAQCAHEQEAERKINYGVNPFIVPLRELERRTDIGNRGLNEEHGGPGERRPVDFPKVAVHGVRVVRYCGIAEPD